MVYWVLHGLVSIRELGIGWDKIEYPGFYISFFLDGLDGMQDWYPSPNSLMIATH